MDRKIIGMGIGAFLVIVLIGVMGFAFAQDSGIDAKTVETQDTNIIQDSVIHECTGEGSGNCQNKESCTGSGHTAGGCQETDCPMKATGGCQGKVAAEKVGGCGGSGHTAGGCQKHAQGGTCTGEGFSLQ